MYYWNDFQPFASPIQEGDILIIDSNMYFMKQLLRCVYIISVGIGMVKEENTYL